MDFYRSCVFLMPERASLFIFVIASGLYADIRLIRGLRLPKVLCRHRPRELRRRVDFIYKGFQFIYCGIEELFSSVDLVHALVV